MKETILVLSSSANRDGNSAFLAKEIAKKINQDKYEIEFIYLYDLDIEYFSNENRSARVEDDARNKDVRKLIDKIEATSKIIIATPIWNLSIPAALKNVIDRASISGRVWSDEKKQKIPAWQGKKIYLFFTMGASGVKQYVNFMGIGSLFFTLIYYGASPKILYKATNCGNGSKLVLDKRESVIKDLHNLARKYFR